MNEKKYLIYLDILGFKKLPKILEERSGFEEDIIREYFLTDALKKKINEIKRDKVQMSNAISEITGSDNYVLIVDDIQTAFELVGEFTTIKIPHKDCKFIPLEVALGTKRIGGGGEVEPINKKEVIEFLDDDIINPYRDYHTIKNGEAIKETFVLVTQEFFDELEPLYKKYCEQISHSDKTFFVADLEKIRQKQMTGERFSQQWFENRIEEAVANITCYSPKLNVELPIARLFDGLGRTSEFHTHVKDIYGKINRSYSKAWSRRSEESATGEFKSLRENISPLLLIMGGLEETEVDPIEWDSVVESASESIKFANDCIQKLKIAAEEEKKKVIANKEQESHTPAKDFEYELDHLYELIGYLDSLRDFAQSSEAHLFSVPALLLVGDAGTGKTHLFCDVAKERVKSGLPTVLLGGLLNDDEPWSQIISLLGLTCDKEDFLGALEAAAQARGARVLILIDALNEGEGKKLWNKHLAGMLATLTRYPWVGVAVSVRTSYESMVIPDGLVPDRLIREVHHGFTGHEYEATRMFFDYFGIKSPSIPLLLPEFQTPLFLLLFCEALKNLGRDIVPPGHRGITKVFELFIKSINKKLSKPEYLDFDPEYPAVRKAVRKLAEMMADRGTTWLQRDEARDAVDTILHCDGYERSLFRHIISEGLLAEDRFRIEDDAWCEGVHFSYKRFTDHLVAKLLIDKNIDLANPSHSFLPDRTLGSFIKDERACERNPGLIEAFAIQLPERIKKELPDVAPHCADYQPVREAFVESLIWRDPKAITNATLNYIDEHILKYDDTRDQFFNALLTVASNPDHPYNADFLHEYLKKKFELAERDALWSIFLHHQYGKHGAVDRLVDWAWSSEDKSHIDDEPIRLCGIALAWFLTTSNRYLRDRATKALVSLLTNRIHLLRPVIREFLNVNDPYVRERLFAVAYGCAMRSTNDDAISDLAKDVYEWIFKNGEPPPHILLRDYARGVIELALHRGIELDLDAEKIRPPYKSEWPSFEIPAEDALEKKYGAWHEDMSDGELAQVDLYYSVMGSGDFARYIIGTDSRPFGWLSRRLGEVGKQTLKDTYNDFVRSLTGIQCAAWDKYLDFRRQKPIEIVIQSASGDKDPKMIAVSDLDEEDLEKTVGSSEQAFRKTLGKKKLKIFEESVLPYLKDPPKYEEEQFDLSIAQRWILKRVFDLGWTVERFGLFDGYVNRHSSFRTAKKPERMGKKYQWIAYHEFLARVSDNFEFRGDWESDQPQKYEGPWQISGGIVRDIDPSCLLRRTEQEEYGNPHTTAWWFPAPYATWDSEPDDVAWLKSSDDLPLIEPLIEVTNPGDGSRWLVLEAIYRWEKPTPPEKERSEIQRRNMLYMLKSYIVKKSDVDELFERATKQNFWGDWMPRSHELDTVFMGEFFWAPAFQHHDIPDHYHDGWTQSDQIPEQILVSTYQYMQGASGYDCSIDETINIYLPAKRIADQMVLQWNGVDGYFIDGRDDLIAFDPSIRTSGPGALLINRDTFLKFLDENDYDVLWTLVGEKRIMGDQRSPDGWKGQLELSGAYRIREGNVYGKIYIKKFIQNPRTKS